MAEKQEIFVDGIGKIHFTGGMVRYDLVTMEPDENGKNPTPEDKVRIIMPPDGFLATFNTMQRLIDQLLEAGVLKKNENVKK
ncbi:MAG: hypothetical protein K9L78_05030 [Victivallales bacterium]|nr:hypothetical protein [Victivallales bacterium]MCF7889467.1 hypothetical protein [Victivallales bacterium]